MGNNTIETTIKTVIGNRLKIDQSIIYPNSTLIDLGANSLDQVEIIMDIENEFDILLQANYPSKLYIEPLKDLYCYVENIISGKHTYKHFY